MIQRERSILRHARIQSAAFVCEISPGGLSPPRHLPVAIHRLFPDTATIPGPWPAREWKTSGLSYQRVSRQAIPVDTRMIKRKRKRPDDTIGDDAIAHEYHVKSLTIVITEPIILYT